MTSFVDENVKLGERIRKKRKAMNLTQRDLAKHLGISVQQMQKYESGRNRISAVNLLSIENLIGHIRDSFTIPSDSIKKYNLMGSDVASQKLVSVISQLSQEQQKALHKFVVEMLKSN